MLKNWGASVAARLRFYCQVQRWLISWPQMQYVLNAVATGIVLSCVATRGADIPTAAAPSMRNGCYVLPQSPRFVRLPNGDWLWLSLTAASSNRGAVALFGRQATVFSSELRPPPNAPSIADMRRRHPMSNVTNLERLAYSDSILGVTISESDARVLSIIGNPMPARRLENVRAVANKHGGWDVLLITDAEEGGFSEIWYGHWANGAWKTPAHRVWVSDNAEVSPDLSSHLVVNGDEIAYAFAFLDRRTSVLLRKGPRGWRADTLRSERLMGSAVELEALHGAWWMLRRPFALHAVIVDSSIRIRGNIAAPRRSIGIAAMGFFPSREMPRVWYAEIDSGTVGRILTRRIEDGGAADTLVTGAIAGRILSTSIDTSAWLLLVPRLAGGASVAVLRSPTAIWRGDVALRMGSRSFLVARSRHNVWLVTDQTTEVTGDGQPPWGLKIQAMQVLCN